MQRNFNKQRKLQCGVVVFDHGALLLRSSWELKGAGLLLSLGLESRGLASAGGLKTKALKRVLALPRLTLAGLRPINRDRKSGKCATLYVKKERAILKKSFVMLRVCRTCLPVVHSGMSPYLSIPGLVVCSML